MSVATRTPSQAGRDEVITFTLGPGGLGTFLEAVPEPPGRIRYRDRRLTIVSPSPPHEEGVKYLSDLVEAIGDELDIPYSPTGSTLFRRDDLDRGVQPDASYYIEHQGALAGVRETVDLRRYPPPDLVLEAVWTHGADDSLEILAGMGVPEVWLYDIPTDRLQFLQLGPDGTYAAQPRSRSFPFLTADDAIGLLRTIQPGEPHNRWKRRLREWVRETLGPRRAADV